MVDVRVYRVYGDDAVAAEARVYEISGEALTGAEVRVYEITGSFVFSEARIYEIGGTITFAAANAGEDRTGIEPGAVVTLDGSASISGATFLWECVSYGTTGPPTIINPTSKIASYVAPAEFEAVPLVFRLTVDGTSSDTVTHQVYPHIEWMRIGWVWTPLFN